MNEGAYKLWLALEEDVRKAHENLRTFRKTLMESDILEFKARNLRESGKDSNSV